MKAARKDTSWAAKWAQLSVARKDQTMASLKDTNSAELMAFHSVVSMVVQKDVTWAV